MVTEHCAADPATSRLTSPLLWFLTPVCEGSRPAWLLPRSTWWSRRPRLTGALCLVPPLVTSRPQHGPFANDSKRHDFPPLSCHCPPGPQPRRKTWLCWVKNQMGSFSFHEPHPPCLPSLLITMAYFYDHGGGAVMIRQIRQFWTF